MAKRKLQPVDTTVGDAINTMCSGIESLGQELRDWYDNMPENMQGGSKGDEVDEAATTLEDISEPDVPASIKDFPLSFRALPLLKRATRSDRLDDFLSYGRQAIEVIEARIEGLAVRDPARTEEDQQEEIDAMETLRDETQQCIDDAENVSFPGAY